MKAIKITIISAIFLAAFSNVRASAHENTNFQKQLTSVVEKYVVLKNALVAGDEAKATTAAKETLEALDKVDMHLLEGEDHMAWMKWQKPIKANLNGIVQMQGLEMKRSHFRIVSDNLTKAVQNFGVEDGKKVYVDFCPMTNNGNGGFWLSETEEIRNPYYGKKMLTCGEVKDVIQ